MRSCGACLASCLRLPRSLGARVSELVLGAIACARLRSYHARRRVRPPRPPFARRVPAVAALGKRGAQRAREARWEGGGAHVAIDSRSCGGRGGSACAGISSGATPVASHCASSSARRRRSLRPTRAPAAGRARVRPSAGRRARGLAPRARSRSRSRAAAARASSSSVARSAALWRASRRQASARATVSSSPAPARAHLKGAAAHRAPSSPRRARRLAPRRRGRAFGDRDDHAAERHRAAQLHGSSPGDLRSPRFRAGGRGALTRHSAPGARRATRRSRPPRGACANSSFMSWNFSSAVRRGGARRQARPGRCPGPRVCHSGSALMSITDSGSLAASCWLRSLPLSPPPLYALP